MKRTVNLGHQLFLSLKKGFFETALLDYSRPEPIRLNRGMLLVLALELSNHLRSIDDQRVGVALPPGAAGVLTNLAIFLTGKTPVNLNFTTGAGAASRSIEKARITTIVSADAVVRKFPDFPWTREVFDVGDWIKETSSKKLFLISKFCLLACRNGEKVLEKLPLSMQGPNSEATLLFTSGSSGNPKGVSLSHLNLLSNCDQIASAGLFKKKDKVLSNLPLFHSFGFTVATLYPLLHDLVMVCSPSPLDCKSTLRAIENEKVEIVLGTPTFLKGYLRKAHERQLQSIRYVIAGAERTPAGFKDKWELACGCKYLEGYGLTEASPGISFNLPGSGSKEGSVGLLLPQIELKTIDPESGVDLPRGSRGVLCFRGPNVFSGYLDEPEANKKTIDPQGWLVTGDLGRLDEDGFLFLSGRLARFSKIGGEMVPHERIEELIAEVLDSNEDVPQCAIVGVEDENKGEKLILLTTQALNPVSLRKALLQKGVSNLWIPKEIIDIEEVPRLASGKLDIRKLKEIAQQTLE